MNFLFEYYTRENEEKSLDSYLNPNAKEEKPAKETHKTVRKPAEKAAAKASEKAKQPTEVLKKADGTVVEMPRPKSEKKSERTQGSVRREVVTKVVDTRTVDVNLDKFNEKYTELAGTKNVDDRRKSSNSSNKHKLNNNRNRGRQNNFQKKA